MAILSLFLFLSLGVGVGVLWFYSGPKSDEIKIVLKKIFSNFKDLLLSFKDLFVIIIDLIQSEPEDSSAVVDINIKTDLTNSSSDKTVNKVEVNDSELNVQNDQSDNNFIQEIKIEESNFKSAVIDTSDNKEDSAA